MGTRTASKEIHSRRYHARVLVLFMAFSRGCLVAGGPGAQLLGVGDAPLRTQGRFIVDRLGNRVKWACVNYFGAESKSMVAGGLEVRRIEDIAARVVELGFNCIRLPYSVEANLKNPVVEDEFVAANPELQGKHYMDVLTATVEAFTNVGLMVILDNHVSRAGWCCFPGQDEGLWYVDGFPADMWLDSLGNMTAHFRSNPLVVGHSLRNEVHDYGGTQLTWGDGNPYTDWHLAATRGGNRVLQEDPDMIVIVMGLCAGICLNPVRDLPVILNIPNRVVYEVHNYIEYVFTNLVPRDVISWDNLRIIIRSVMLVMVAAIIKVFLDWQELGKPIPPISLVLLPAGCFIAFAGLLGCIATVVVFVVWNHLACHWWAYNVVLTTWIHWPLIYVVAGVASILTGLFTFRSSSASDSAPGEQEQLVSNPDRKNSFTTSSTSWPFAWRIRLYVFVLCSLLFIGSWRVLGVVDLWSSYAWERKFLDEWWGFILEEGQPYTAPVWMGEFGYANQGVYWKNFVRYLSDRDVDFAYWALNGKKYGEGFINDKTGKFIVWAGCDTWHRSMTGVDCVDELGDWAGKGRGTILDAVYFDYRPDTCVYNAPTAGSCHNYCKDRGRKCVKARANESICGLSPALDDSEEDGCMQSWDNQICVCTRQLWVWDNETFGLLNRDYESLQAAWRLRDLQGLAKSPSGWFPRDIGCLQDYYGHVCQGT